jgi:hypothetical protein
VLDDPENAARSPTLQPGGHDASSSSIRARASMTAPVEPLPDGFFEERNAPPRGASTGPTTSTLRLWPSYAGARDSTSASLDGREGSRHAGSMANKS